jgi:HD-GYP domain-containing protein (c-di-GMP phosphodiesterase class II)
MATDGQDAGAARGRGDAPETGAVPDGGGGPVRLGELVAILALGQDSAFGQPLESQMRSTVLAAWLAGTLGLDAGIRDAAYWVGQLRYVGCTGHAHEVAVMFGDEIATRARSLVYDAGDPAEVLRDALAHAMPGRRGPARVLAVAAVLAGGRRFAEMNFRTGCEVADMIAGRLGMSAAVRSALRYTFERWNGKGQPTGATGKDIPLPMRIVHLTQDMEALARLRSPGEAVERARRRTGRSYDPALVDAFLPVAAEFFARLEKIDPWDQVLALEPEPHRMLAGGALDDALLAAADFADLKSPYTAGHSRGVAELAASACERAGLGADEVTAARRAGLVHDLGRTAIPNSIWDKDGPLTRAETDRMGLHPLLGEQMLRRSAGLGCLIPVAASHHERADGSGYVKGLTAAQVPPAARVLAPADRYQGMTQERAHRPAMGPPAAAAELRRMASEGHLDPEAAEQVLAAAGHAPRKVPVVRPGGLTAREAEVLRLLGLGLTTKAIAARLVISFKTADAHVQHIYAKIGVSTRGAAALFAIQHNLLH